MTIYKLKKHNVEARQAEVPEFVYTEHGTRRAEVGDWVVTDKFNNETVMHDADFKAKYEIVKGGGNK